MANSLAICESNQSKVTFVRIQFVTITERVNRNCPIAQESSGVMQRINLHLPRYHARCAILLLAGGSQTHL